MSDPEFIGFAVVVSYIMLKLTIGFKFLRAVRECSYYTEAVLLWVLDRAREAFTKQKLRLVYWILEDLRAGRR